MNTEHLACGSCNAITETCEFMLGSVGMCVSECVRVVWVRVFVHMYACMCVCCLRCVVCMFAYVDPCMCVWGYVLCYLGMSVCVFAPPVCDEGGGACMVLRDRTCMLGSDCSHVMSMVHTDPSCVSNR